MHTLKVWFLSILTIIILGCTGFIIYTSRQAITNAAISVISPILLLIHVFIICLIVLVIAVTILAIVYASVYIYKHFAETEISEIGQHGSLLVSHGKHVTVSPMQVKQIAQEKQQKEIAEKIPVPKLSELLLSGHLRDLIENATMLFGYRDDGTEKHGTNDDIRTCGLGGKSRYGKSNTLFFFVIQFVLAHAKCYICDKHFMKSTSLYRMLTPLAKYVRLAGKHEEIVLAVNEFASELNARIDGTSINTDVRILIIDEWTQCSMDKELMKLLSHVVLRISNEGAGFNMFTIIGGQSWQASTAGGNVLINSLHASIVHHLEEDESKKLLGKKRAKLTPSLQKGQAIIKDTGGDIDKVNIPLGNIKDAAIVAKMLEAPYTYGGTDVYLTPFPYQEQFQPYNPYLLRQPENNSMTNHPTQPLGASISKHPVQRLNEQTAMHIPPLSTQAKEAVPVSNKATIIAENGITISGEEQVIIENAVTHVLSQAHGRKLNGKVNRTMVRDTLEWNNQQYRKIQVYCNAMDY